MSKLVEIFMAAAEPKPSYRDPIFVALDVEAGVAAVRRAALEEVAAFVKTHDYVVRNNEPFYSMQPARRPGEDVHHATIAEAILALIERAP